MSTYQFKKWWLLLIKGFILILLAFIILLNPGQTLMVISIYMGISLIITGIALILISVELKKAMENWTFRLAEGLLDIVFGFFLLAHPDASSQIIPILIGFWVIFYGVLILSGSFQFSDSMKVRKKAIQIVGIITIILGFIIAFNPNITIITVGMLIGIPVLIIGLANLFFAVNLKNLDQDGLMKRPKTENE